MAYQIQLIVTVTDPIIPFSFFGLWVFIFLLILSGCLLGTKRFSGHQQQENLISQWESEMVRIYRSGLQSGSKRRRRRKEGID